VFSVYPTDIHLSNTQYTILQYTQTLWLIF